MEDKRGGSDDAVLELCEGLWGRRRAERGCPAHEHGRPENPDGSRVSRGRAAWRQTLDGGWAAARADGAGRRKPASCCAGGSVI